MSIDPRIFRAYDIRGKAHEQITEESALLIGKGFGSVLREQTGKDHPTLCVGRDARTHSPLFEKNIVEGLVSTGCNVLLIGETPSPVNYFTICTQKLDGGIHITASHNPATDNGFKLQLKDAEPYSGHDLQDLKNRIEKNDFKEGTGSTDMMDAVTPYIQFLKNLFAGKGNDISIVMDGGNGVAGPCYSKTFEEVGCTVSGLYLEPDGTFPNHAADPSKHDTLKELQAKVVAQKAHFGLAFDGDGDRVGVVDEAGKIITADEILLLLSKDHLQKFPGAPIVFTVSNSGTLQSEITRWGGKPIMCKVGHSFVEHAMRDANAKLAGEQSGHFFCGENYFSFDDALVTALRILSIFASQKEKPFSELFSEFPKVFQAPERRPFCPDEKKGEVIEKVIAHFSKNYPIETMDGARIDFGENAWAGIRQSNTSPCLSICLEARSEEKLQQMETEVLSHLKTYPEVKF